MSFTVIVAPTLTGGTSVTLVPTGNGTGKYVYPGGTRLERTEVELFVQQKGTSAKPVASTGLRLTDRKVSESEGCCSVAADTIAFNLGVLYPLMSGIEALDVEGALDRFLAVVNSDEFKAAIMNGVLPA